MSTAVRISGARPPGRGVVRGLSWVLVFLLVFFGAALVSMVYGEATSPDAPPLGEVLWSESHRALTVATAVLGVLAAAALTALVAGTPRSRAPREVRAGPEGIELTARPTGWYRGDGAVVPWDAVQVISAPRVVFAESTGGTSQRHVPREVLDLYLFRGVEGLPDFARSEAVDGAPLEGLRAPAVRVRIGGPGKRLAASVREVAAALDGARPDLFYRGTAVDQWFAPSAPAAQPVGEAAPPRSAAPAAGTPVADEPVAGAPAASGYALPTALWLDFRHPPRRAFGVLTALVLLAAACYVPIDLLAGTDGGILVGLAGLVLAVPFLIGVLGALFTVLGLPRMLARTGVRIDADGLELVGKSPWALRRLERGRIPWSDVRAIVARESAALDEHGLQRPRAQPVTDLYLSGDTAFRRPGVGLSVEVTRLEEPDSAHTRALAGFPAVRVRLPHSPAAELQTAGEWAGLPSEGPGPARLSGAQLRAALLAARPDLCHGFGDRGPAGA